MNEHEELIGRLDELGAAAAAGTTPPPFDPHWRRRRPVRHRRGLALLATAALLLAAGGTVAVLRLESHRQIDTMPADTEPDSPDRAPCSNPDPLNDDGALFVEPDALAGKPILSSMRPLPEGIADEVEVRAAGLAANVSMRIVGAAEVAAGSGDGDVTLEVCDPASSTGGRLEVPARWVTDGGAAAELTFDVLAPTAETWRITVEVTVPDGDAARTTAIEVAEAVRWTISPNLFGLGLSSSTDLVAPPAGWEPVDHGEMRVFLPPDWEVVKGECPGEDRTVALGPAPADERCSEPEPGAAWVWVAPTEEVADRSAGCTVGTSNHIPGCLVQNLDSGEEIQFAQGVNVALVTQRGGSGEEVSQISSTWRYADQSRTEAQPGRPQPSALWVAQDFAVALAAGRCDDAARLSAPGLDTGCVPSDPPVEASALESALTSPSGAVPTQWTRIVTAPDDRALYVELQAEWSTEHRAAIWKVIQVVPDPWD